MIIVGFALMPALLFSASLPFIFTAVTVMAAGGVTTGGGWGDFFLQEKAASESKVISNIFKLGFIMFLLKYK